MTKIRSNNSLYPHRHFTEQLVGAFRKSPWESDLNQEPSSLLIRRLKNHTGIHLASIHTTTNSSNWRIGGWLLGTELRLVAVNCSHSRQRAESGWCHSSRRSESQKKKNFGGDSPAKEPSPGGEQIEKRNTVTGGGCSRNARSEGRVRRTGAAKMKRGMGELDRN
jgi:hypothetical protein